METIPYFDLKHIQDDSKSYGQTSEGYWGDNLEEKTEINCYSIHNPCKIMFHHFL
jgi:hypothetical protein